MRHNTLSDVIDVFLQPGDFYFGDRDTRIRTLLGSCISITMWHPRLLIGGMSHYMLPKRKSGSEQQLNGRYADEAMKMFMYEIQAAKTSPQEYEVKLFGGGNMFAQSKRRKLCGITECTISTMGNCKDVACKNVKIARLLVEQYGFTVTSEHMGGNGHRQIMFDISNGHAWVKYKQIEKQRAV